MSRELEAEGGPAENVPDRPRYSRGRSGLVPMPSVSEGAPEEPCMGEAPPGKNCEEDRRRSSKRLMLSRCTTSSAPTYPSCSLKSFDDRPCGPPGSPAAPFLFNPSPFQSYLTFFDTVVTHAARRPFCSLHAARHCVLTPNDRPPLQRAFDWPETVRSLLLPIQPQFQIKPTSHCSCRGAGGSQS